MIKNKSATLEALRIAATDEAKSVEFLEGERWSETVVCPRCESTDLYKVTGRDGQRNKDYRWRCCSCKKFFTVRTGTIFEETRLPLQVWIFAFWKACASKKGISALQLSREMLVTHKSALFILRRIRDGMGEVNAPTQSGFSRGLRGPMAGR
jgi:transposase-like protein